MPGTASGLAAPVPRFDVFLSYNRRDGATVERIAERLTQAGVDPWLDRWSLTPGGAWQSELGAGLDASVACAVFVGRHDLGAWELQEVAIAIDRAAREQGFRVFPVLLAGVEEPFDPNRLPHFLRARTWVDFRRGRDDPRALQDLINAIKGVPFGPRVAVTRAAQTAPYRGLQVFREEDSTFFFGRDSEIQRMLEKLKTESFLALLGPSGSGKSSLVRAGLVPALRAGALPDVEEWHVLVLRPGAAPLTALAAQLSRLRPGEAMQRTLDALASDPRTLHLSVELALADSPVRSRALLVVDQLEEVFTSCRDDAERRQLFSCLLHASSAPGGRSTVIVTLRSDFYTRCAGYPELAQLIAAQQMLLGPMDAEGLRQAIEQPARQVGLQLEEGLSETIVDDFGGESGALPLLEHALLELWERRRGRLMTLEGYRDAGGVHGALARRADAVYDGLSDVAQRLAKRTLMRLTQPGEGTEDTRRRATYDELVPAGGADAFEVVIGRLVEARMLTTGRDESGAEVVDVSHEALIRGWPKLRGWIEADRAGLLTHRRFTDAAQEWERLDREPAALYRGARLAASREWAADHDGDLSGLEREYLAASDGAEQRELESVKRRTRRLRAVAAGLAGLVAIVVVLAALAIDQRDTAQRRGDDARREATEATSLALASSSSALLSTRPDVALLLALEAYRESPRLEARSSALAAFVTAREAGVVAILNAHAAAVFGVAFSPDGRVLAAAANDGTVRLWDTRTRRPLGTLAGHTDVVRSIAFARDGHTLASVGDDRTIRLWDTRTRRPLGVLRGHTDIVRSVTFSPDGSTLASSGDDRTVRLWDPRLRELRGTLRGHADAVFSVAISPDGRTVASASQDRTVRLWSVHGRSALATLTGHDASVNGVAFAPDGRTLAATGEDRTLRLWDVRRRRSLGRLKGSTSPLYGVAFSPDGRTVAAASTGKSVWWWDLRTRKPLQLEGHSNAVISVAFAPDGRTLASAGLDGTMRLWDVHSRRPPDQLVGHRGYVDGVAFGPSGRLLASASGDRTVRLWDLRSRRTVATFRGHASTVNRVAFSEDGRMLASAGSDETVRLWDVNRRKPLASLTGHTGAVNDVAFTRDGRILASAGGDATVRLWDVRTRRPLATLKGHRRAVYDVTFSNDGRTLASTSVDNSILLWDAATRTLRGRLVGHAGYVLAAAFSPDGLTLATAGLDRSVRLWDVRRRAPIATLSGHTGTIHGVAFSPDGRTLASAGEDSRILLWDADTGKSLGKLGSKLGSIFDVAFSPDSRTLAAGTADGRVLLSRSLSWRTLGELETQICHVVGSGLTKLEWSQFAGGTRYRRSCT